MSDNRKPDPQQQCPEPTPGVDPRDPARRDNPSEERPLDEHGDRKRDPGSGHTREPGYDEA
jgi:hypothetical protein